MCECDRAIHIHHRGRGGGGGLPCPRELLPARGRRPNFLVEEGWACGMQRQRIETWGWELSGRPAIVTLQRP